MKSYVFSIDNDVLGVKESFFSLERSAYSGSGARAYVVDKAAFEDQMPEWVKRRSRRSGQARMTQISRRHTFQYIPVEYKGVATLRNNIWKTVSESMRSSDDCIFIFGVSESLLRAVRIAVNRKDYGNLFGSHGRGSIFPMSQDKREAVGSSSMAMVPAGTGQILPDAVRRTNTVRRDYQYLGASHFFTHASFDSGWGTFFVENRKRSRRRLPLQNSVCDFCDLSRSTENDRAVSRFVYYNREYVIVTNDNPIIRRQLVIFPAVHKPRNEPATHRIDADDADLNLIMEIVSNGFSRIRFKKLDEEHRAMISGENERASFAAYLNCFPGTGRSMPHMHINCFPSDFAPMPDWKVARWEICHDAGTMTDVRRVLNPFFYAITFTGGHPIDQCKTIVSLHESMNNCARPFNLIAYLETPDEDNENKGDGNRPKKPPVVRLVVIPRSREYSPAVDQKLGGQEFLTGILLPGDARIAEMHASTRNRAFRETTLTKTEILDFEKDLRSLYSLPRAGQVLLPVSSALDGPGVFRTTIRDNDIYERPGMEARVLSWKVLPIAAVRTMELDDTIPDILIRITRAGLSRIDWRVLTGRRAGAGVPRFALGREAGGYVVDPGGWRRYLDPGDKVALIPHVRCRRCVKCRDVGSADCYGIRSMGIDFDGCLANMIAAPFSCLVPVKPDFDDDALPLVGPLAGVIHAIFKIKSHCICASEADSAAQHPHRTVIYGGGPMGALCCITLKRFWPELAVTIVEPDDIRRTVLRNMRIADSVVSDADLACKHTIGIVAANSSRAVYDAVRMADRGAVVLLLADADEDTNEASAARRPHDRSELHRCHREESIIAVGSMNDVNQPYYRLVGSFGCTRSDVDKAVCELYRNPDLYTVLQNVRIAGIASRHATLNGKDKLQSLGKSFVEALLSPLGAQDPVNGKIISQTLKPLIEM